MGTILTTRLPDDLAAEIERISEEEKLDKSAVARRLLKQAVKEHNRKRAFDQYEQGEISLGIVADRTGLSIREVLTELRRRDVHFQYSLESLEEDFGDA
jgi:predicted HTH domain antitoxin